jgi:hypothetical protein
MAARVMPQPTPAQPSNALARWQRITIVAMALNLLASGLVWLPFHYLWGAGSANALPHPLEVWLMRWHGLAAVAGFYAAGIVSAGHVARGWRLRWRRSSGLAVCILGGALALSGYALWYFVPEALHAAVGLAHAAAGAVAFAVGWAHVAGSAPRRL